MAVRAQFENSNEYDHETLKKPFLSKASDYLFIFFLKSSVSGTLFLVILFFYCYYHQIAAIAYVANSFSTYVSLPSMKSRRLRDTHKFILSRGHRRIGKLLQVHTLTPPPFYLRIVFPYPLYLSSSSNFPPQVRHCEDNQLCNGSRMGRENKREEWFKS